MVEALRLVLDLHCHQPIGNFGFVIEKATAGSYRPLLEALARHPRVPCVLHVSGPLLEWWLDHARDLVELVRSGVARGQIELQASGLYEPILPSIPRRDRVDQVRLHRAWLADLFGADATSLWLTERVWEPSLPSDLCAAGIRSVLVDDTHFEGAGLSIDALDGCYTTEDEGHVVRLFPISQKLRYLIPFRPVAEILAWLRERHAAGRKLVVFGDDGEKFGLWPGTAEWVFGAGWLEQFLTSIEEARAWLRPTTLAEAAGALPPAGRVYLPTASYFEMGHWSLPPPAQLELESTVKQLDAPANAKLAAAVKPFLRGATWRNFLARYPEANRLARRMVRLSDQTQRMGLRPHDGLKSMAQLHPALRALFRGQCNCAYWHGVFGGLYLPFLRDAIVDEQLLARAQLEELRGDQAGAPRSAQEDLDGDGVDEVLLEGRGWSAWIAPSRGGLVELLDHWPTRRNLLNGLARVPEAYHEELRRAGSDASGAGPPKSIHEQTLSLENAAELLRYDERPRGAFALELVADGPGLEEALLATVETRGPDRHGVATARLRLARPLQADRARVDLAATVEAARGTRLDVQRSYELQEDGTLEASIVLQAGGRPLPVGKATLRFDLSVPGAGLDERRFVLQDGRRIAAGEAVRFAGDALELHDERGRFRLDASRPFLGRIAPIRTVSRSESGVETCLQGSALLLCFDVGTLSGEPWRVLLRLKPLPAAAPAAPVAPTLPR
jgi:alpha-amylase